MRTDFFLVLTSGVLFCEDFLGFGHIFASCQLSTYQEFSGGGVQQIQLTVDRENGDLGVVAPLVRGSGGSCNLV
jgi:hypothetical protein